MRKPARQHSLYLLDVFPVISQPRYLMLATELALAFQPCREHTLLQRMQDRQTKGDILMSFCFVVAIDALQGLVELADKKRHISGLPLEFNQPFMSAVSRIPEIDRGRRIVIHDSTRLFRRYRNGLVRIVHDHFFAKGIDKMLEPPADLYPEREQRSKLDGVPQQIPPSPPIGIDHQRILLPQHHI